MLHRHIGTFIVYLHSHKYAPVLLATPYVERATRFLMSSPHEEKVHFKERVIPREGSVPREE